MVASWKEGEGPAAGSSSEGDVRRTLTGPGTAGVVRPDRRHMQGSGRCRGRVRRSGLDTHGSGLVTHGSGLDTQGSGLVTRGSGLVIHGSGLDTHGSDLDTHGAGWDTRGSGSVTRGSGLDTHGSGLVTPCIFAGVSAA